MDLIKKLSLLANEDRKDEIRFREMMIMREKIAKIKVEISEIDNDCRSLEKRINSVEQKSFELEIEVKILEKQEMIIKDIAGKKLTEVLHLENDLKKLKSDYKNDVKSAIKEIKTLKDGYTSEMDLRMIGSSSKNEKNPENIRETWKHEGEMEAVELYEKYQDEKAMEMNRINEMLEKHGLFDKVNSEGEPEEKNME